jgi:hypothetical protein
MKRQIVCAVTTAVTFGTMLPALADYTLMLKNGRRITVQSYREDQGMIKFYGLGGEIAVSKDQIQTIQQTTEQDSASLALPGFTTPPAAITKGPAGQPKTLPPLPKAKEPTAAEKLAEQRAKEEKEYQDKLKDMTERIKQLREEYARLTRGNTGPEPFLFTSEEAFRGHQADLLSRLRAAQNNPGLAQDLGPVNLITSLPENGPPTITQVRPQPPSGPTGILVTGPYSEKEKELTDLRNRIIELQKERQRIIEEMGQKNFETGSLFLE